MIQKNLIGSLKGKLILVVDDIKENQILEALYLQKAGAAVEFAANGLEAIEKAKNRDFDAILMDLHMPYLDGLSATAELRHKGYQKPIIAVTADVQSNIRERAYEVGISDYLVKPITLQNLVETLGRGLRYFSKSHAQRSSDLSI